MGCLRALGHETQVLESKPTVEFTPAGYRLRFDPVAMPAPIVTVSMIWPTFSVQVLDQEGLLVTTDDQTLLTWQSVSSDVLLQGIEQPVPVHHGEASFTNVVALGVGGWGAFDTTGAGRAPRCPWVSGGRGFWRGALNPD